MIILSVIFLIASFLIQGISSNYLSYLTGNISFLSCLYVLITLINLKQYYESDKKYLLLLIIFGLLLDIVYSGTFILNATIFLIIYFFNKLFFTILPYNLIMTNVSSLFSIFIYHVITFLFLNILNYDNYSLSILFNTLINNIIMTIIYTSINYLLIKFFKEKFELKEVR